MTITFLDCLMRDHDYTHPCPWTIHGNDTDRRVPDCDAWCAGYRLFRAKAPRRDAVTRFALRARGGDGYVARLDDPTKPLLFPSERMAADFAMEYPRDWSGPRPVGAKYYRKQYDPRCSQSCNGACQRQWEEGHQRPACGGKPERTTPKDALFWHRPGQDDTACFRAYDKPVIVRILASQYVRRYVDTFSIWIPEDDDWLRSRNGSRRAWSYIWSAERALLVHNAIGD